MHDTHALIIRGENTVEQQLGTVLNTSAIISFFFALNTVNLSQFFLGQVVAQIDITAVFGCIYREKKTA